MNQVNPTDFKKLFAPKDFKNQWNEEIKIQEYHGDKNAVNSSSLKKMIKSPLAFHESFYGDDIEQTDAMRLGTIAHMAILQGDLFKSKYLVMPEFKSLTADGKPSESKATKYYKDQVAEWTKSLPKDALVVTKEEQNKLFGMIESLTKHEMAVKLLSNGKPELCGYWRDEETGIRCRMQADFVSFDLGALVDLKTTSDCSWPEFRRTVEKLDYSFQMSMYAEGIKQITGKRPEHIIWIAIESKPPYEVRAYEMSPHYEIIGNHNFRYSLQKLKECIDSNKFEPLQKEIEIAEPSPWYFKNYEDKGVFNNI